MCVCVCVCVCVCHCVCVCVCVSLCVCVLYALNLENVQIKNVEAPRACTGWVLKVAIIINVVFVLVFRTWWREV